MNVRSDEQKALAKVVGARIRRARRAKFPPGSGAAAAEAIGMGTLQLMRMERGVNAPSFYNLHKIIHALDIDPRELFAPVRPEEFDDDEARNN